MNRNYQMLIVSLMGIALIGTPTMAANVSWTGGAGDWLYTTGANWNTNNPPANTDYSDTAVFGGTATPGTIVLGRYPNPWNPTPISPNLGGIQFTTTGWTLSNSAGVNFSEVTILSSSGTGTNTIAASFNSHADGTWTVATDNTLVLALGFYEKNKNINLTGGGTLEVGAAIGGYGSGAWGIHIQDATLRVNASTAYSGSTSGAAYLSSEDATLQLMTTVSGATSQIGTRIIDETGLGLTVTDIGGGYVEVSVVPEPATLSLLAVGSGLVLLRKRRMQR